MVTFPNVVVHCIDIYADDRMITEYCLWFPYFYFLDVYTCTVEYTLIYTNLFSDPIHQDWRGTGTRRDQTGKISIFNSLNQHLAGHTSGALSSPWDNYGDP